LLGPGPLLMKKKKKKKKKKKTKKQKKKGGDLPGRGLTKVEKHWFKRS